MYCACVRCSRHDLQQCRTPQAGLVGMRATSSDDENNEFAARSKGGCARDRQDSQDSQTVSLVIRHTQGPIWRCKMQNARCEMEG